MKGLRMKKSVEKKYRSTKRDQYTIVLEGIRSDFRAFGDGLDFVRDRVVGLESRFDGLENRFGGLENRFGGLEAKVDRLDQKVTVGFADLNKEIKGLRKDVDRHDLEIKELQTVRS